MLPGVMQLLVCGFAVGSASTAQGPDCSITTDPTVWAGSASNTAGVADAGPGATYIWQVSSGMVTGGTGTRQITFTASGAGALNIDVAIIDSNGMGCADVAYVTVNASLILNEYNAVDGDKLLEDNGEDIYWGRVAGNGDDWFEMVVIQDHLDVRGWQFWIHDGTGNPDMLLILTLHGIWADLRSGTILTVSEQLGNNADSYRPEMGRWWFNVKAADETIGTYITASNFRVNNRDWQLTIRNATGVAAFGPAGEGIQPLGGVGSQEVCKLEEQPTAAITPLSNYLPGDTSTFGSPNQWAAGGSVQDFSALRSVVPFAPLQSVRINEVFTHSDAPQVDWVELYNTTDAPIDIGGWYLSDDVDYFERYQIPVGTTIDSNGYLVFEETQLGFAFNSAYGDEVYLSVVDTNGMMTGMRDELVFGAAAQDVSLGRYPNGVGKRYALTSPTRDAFNAPPAIGPVVINELMYHPPDIGSPGLDNVDHEFVELHNVTDTAVALATFFPVANETHPWSLHGGVEFNFALNTTVDAQGYLLVVSFDPAFDAFRLADFRAAYGLSSATPIVGPYTGRLSNSGETVRLRRPDTPQPPGSPDAGFVPQILVEELEYRDRPPWPQEPDGFGASLERILPDTVGDLPRNWRASSSAGGTPGAVNTCPPPGDQDGNGVVNLADYGRLADCLAGPETTPAAPRCGCFDRDADGDVDLRDAAGFQISFEGTSR